VKIKLLILFVFLCFATAGFCQEKPTMTYYNNKVPYKSLFNFKPNPLKVQVRTANGRKVQAEIPVVNDADKDLTQKKGK